MENLQQNLNSIAHFFDLGEIKSFSRAGGLANDNYFIQTNKRRFVIKIMKEHSVEDIKTELPFLQRLKKNAFPASYYLQGCSRVFVFENDTVTAVAMIAEEGSTPQIHSNSLHTMGKVLADLHSVPCEDLSPRSTWFSPTFIKKNLRQIEAAVGANKVKKYRIALEILGNVEDFYTKISIIHGDFTPSNCVFNRGQLVSVIDWEEVSIAPSLFDLALTTLSVCFRDSIFDKELFLALIEGYQTVRSLDMEEFIFFDKIVSYIGLVLSTWVYLRYGLQSEHPQIIKLCNTYWELDLENWIVPDLTSE